MRKKGYEVYEEVVGTAERDSVRRIDIIAIDRKTRTGHILDPTVRYEMDTDQPAKVDEEKRLIYEPTIMYYKTQYNLQNIDVTGLMIGARGTIPDFFVKFTKRFGLPKSLCSN